MPDPRKKIEALIASLEELSLHVGRKDLAIGEEMVNAQLFFPLANACLRNRALLLYGGMGANKTTLINLLGSSFLSLGLGEVENLMVTGHPEQTEEKVVGFLDPRQWTRPGLGPTEVLWTPWARSKWKLINEINRFPSGKQNLFLEIMQKRKISYAGQVLEPGDTCYYATMNPEFCATYPLDEALLDRISACVPATQPDFLAGLALSERDREVWDLAEELPRFEPNEFESLPNYVAAKELTRQVELAIICLIRDFTLCERAPGFDKTQLSGTKPSKGLCVGCHYFNNPEVLVEFLCTRTHIPGKAVLELAEERPGCIILCITDTHIQNLYQEWEDLKKASGIGEFVLFCIDQAYKDKHVEESLASLGQVYYINRLEDLVSLVVDVTERAYAGESFISMQ